MPQLQRAYGRLNCTIVDRIPEGMKPELVVILNHGYGAPGTDLVPLATELLAVAPQIANRVRFVFPTAPLSLEAQGMPGGRAWWHLDILRLTNALERGEFRDLSRELPEGLSTAREMLGELVVAVREETGLPLSRIVLGGFSQGAMLATDFALHQPECPAALCILSGTLLCADHWKTLSAQCRGMRVLQSHGRSDPILPFEAALWIRDLLIDAGAEVEFIEFNGVHTIPMEAVTRLGGLLEELLGPG